MSHTFKKALFLFITLTSISSTAKPISEETATIGAVAGGTAVGLGTGALIYYASFDRRSDQSTRDLVSCGIGLTAGGAAGYFLYQWLYPQTPNHNITIAVQLIQEVANHPHSKLITNANSFISDEKALYDDLSKLELAHQAIKQAQQKMRADASYAQLSQRCTQLTQKADALNVTLKTNLGTVIVHDVATDSLSKAFASVEELATHTTERFGTSWPFVLASFKLSANHKKLLAASSNIAFVLENQTKQAYPALNQQCTLLKEKIDILLPIVSKNSTMLFGHEKYEHQISRYEIHLEHIRLQNDLMMLQSTISMQQAQLSSLENRILYRPTRY